MKIVLSHPTGNANVRNALRALKDINQLAEFHTTVATFDQNIFGYLSKYGFGGQLERRRYDEDLRAITSLQPLREIIRVLAIKYDWHSISCSATGSCSIEKVYEALDRYTAKQLATVNTQKTGAVYCYEDGAAASFKAAKENGMHCIYELPIGYWRSAIQIQSEEAELRPAWAATMPVLGDSKEKLEKKDIELQTADTIIVASQFTASTLKDAPFEMSDPIIIPYGCGTTVTTKKPSVHSDKKLKVLYVGALSQRKGVAYLLDAIKPLDDIIDLTIIGRRTADCSEMDAALNKYRWLESLPHHSILKEMSEHDVFVFPSLFEGFGLVLTEALSQGIPIIATSHTCAPDIMTDGKEGFIIPIRDSDAITEKLELLHEDRELLHSMKRAAIETAQQISWKRYQEKLANTLSGILS